MQHVAPFAAPREDVYAVLASSARSLTYGELSAISAASGVIALAATALHRASWMLLAACYVVWCFAGWGILFHPDAKSRPAPQRVLHLVIVGSATGVFVALAVGVFFWMLGPRWIL